MEYNVNVAKSRLSVGFTKNDNQFVDYWDNNNTFETVNAQKNGNTFVMLDGPPYANGDAHMGHALNKVLKDLVVKSQWFMGNKVNYRPGWDCHGLPLELAVEKAHGKLDAPTLKKYCKNLAFRSLVKQRKSFKSLGVLGQWDKPYVTLSHEMCASSWHALSVLFNKNLLEYKRYPVHHCPACGSSLAEAELENKKMAKDSLYFLMQLHDENHYALVWTTTPWTLPMNQALAYHPEHTFEVWKNDNKTVYLQNSQAVQHWLDQNNFVAHGSVAAKDAGFDLAVSPLSKNSVPVVPANFVDNEHTGFVHVASAHGPEDYELGQQHNLQPVSYLNKHGVFDSQLFPQLQGKKHTQVAKVVCELLEHHLVEHFTSEVEQQVCWRHKCGVYYNATHQVFLKLNDESYNLKAKTQELLSQSEVSEDVKHRLQQMLTTRPHWCLSRQRTWGCPMNLLVDKTTQQLHAASGEYLQLLAENKTELAQQLVDSLNVEVYQDVLDVWFDSGNVANYHASQNPTGNYVANLVCEGKDQFRGWFQSLLWLTVAVNEKMPYAHVLCHGFVLDEKRNKFSKSQGNAKDVSFYSDEYGSDVLRLWVACQENELDAVFSSKKLVEMKTYYSRLRLALRFCSSNLYDYDYTNHANNMAQFKDVPEFDVHRYVLKEVYALQEKMKSDFSQYHFKKAVDALYVLCDRLLSNFYFDWAKNDLYLCSEQHTKRKMVQTGLFEVMSALFDMVKVFCPFVAEEFYQDYFGNACGSVLQSQYFTVEKCAQLHNMQVVFDWNTVQEWRRKVQSALEPLQKLKVVKARTEAGATLLLQKDYALFYMLSQHYRLPQLLAVSQVALQASDNETVEVQDLKADTSYHKCPRCWNYEQHFVGEVCQQCEGDM